MTEKAEMTERANMAADLPKTGNRTQGLSPASGTHPTSGPESMRYLPLRGEDISEVTELYARWLNGGQSIRDDIFRAWDAGAYFGTRAVLRGQTAGIFTMREGLEFTYPHPELEAEVLEQAHGRKIYTSDALLVLPEYRDEGIAHRLIHDTIRQLRQREPGVVLTEIWIYANGKCPAREPLETMGRVFWRKRVPGFYRYLDRYGITCPICGKNCVCGAWVEMTEVWTEPDTREEGK